jgi:uncharacterized protein (DUF1800 family)
MAGLAILVLQNAPSQAASGPFETKLTGDRMTLHALNRLTFGPRPGDLEAVKKVGLTQWIELQLHPERIPANEALDATTKLLVEPTTPAVVTRMSKIRAQAESLVSQTPAKGLSPLPPEARPGQILAQAKLFRATQSDRQLEEILVDFWYNHFNVDAGKESAWYMVTDFEHNAIRPHVLGKFRDLLGATANSGAMLYYLDNWQSSVKGLNENYARELLELHTLGVDGGYTQHDVVEVARCFTGWTLQNAVSGGQTFDEGAHDYGAKTVLGTTIPPQGGKTDGEKVLDILSRHPSTAQWISRKLAQRFVSDAPPQTLIDRMAKTFRETDGDIRAVLTTLFASDEFFSEGAYRAKLKTPLEMVVSSLRHTDAKLENAAVLAARIAALGQPLYWKPEPTGYSNLDADWASSANLLARLNVALDLAANRIPGVTVETSSAHDTGMMLGSPEFQRK